MMLRIGPSVGSAALTAIWSHDGNRWGLLTTQGFPDEARLHGLIEDAPQLLPLAGSPQLAIVGKEVRLGSGYADLLAVESSGRITIIEIKLARNAEARRAVVAQVLAYAAYLRGLDVSTLEQHVLARHLQARGHGSLLAAAQANDQEGIVDGEGFASNLASSLAQGRFRLVFVLDDAPEELVRLTSYLESVADRLLIDLVTVSAYEVGGSLILMPQRVDAEPMRTEMPSLSSATSDGRRSDGADDFDTEIHAAPPESRETLRRYSAWARQLEREGLARLQTFVGTSGRATLLPRLPADGVGLVTIWNDNGNAYLQLWRSVFDRRAPASIARVEEILAPERMRQGNTARDSSDELLAALTDAYRLAAAS